MTTFEFLRFRFRFRTLAAFTFPPGRTANLIRGAFGAALRHVAPLPAYSAFFEPHPEKAVGPSGLADLPRPFVLRPWHLDGRSYAPDETFHIDIHVWDLRSPALPYLTDAFRVMRWPSRGVELDSIEQIDLDERATQACNVISLEPGLAVERVFLRFSTPTELKSGGEIASSPDFSILFRRIRDRIATLCAIYGTGSLAIDFRALGVRASKIRLCRADLVQHQLERRSARTGQVHPLGGFTGIAEYQGDLGEFLPWLHAARWTGVGRQTAWGKGEVLVLVEDVIPG